MENVTNVPVIIPGRPRIKRIYQLVASSPKLEDDPELAFALASDTCWNWLSRKYFNDATIEPPTDSFLHNFPGQNLEVRILDEPKLWTARLEQPDTRFMGRPAVPGRNWRTDISLLLTEGCIIAGVNVIAATVGEASSLPIFLTRPRIAVDLARRLHLSEFKELSELPWIINSEDELKGLLALLQSPLRTIPVIVITKPSGIQYSETEVVDAIRLAEDTQTLAHIVVIPNDLTLAWSCLVTRRWSVYGGAVRTYWPGIDFENDSEFRHPLVIPGRIRDWEFEEISDDGPVYHVGAGAFTFFLIDKAKAHSAKKYIHHPLYVAEARVIEVRQKRERAQRDTRESMDWQEYYREENERLEILLKEKQREISDLEDKLLIADDDYKTLGSRFSCTDQAFRLARLELEKRKAGIAVEEEPCPKDYPSLCQHVDNKLSYGLVLHERARRGLKASNYKNPLLVYKALELLANDWVNVKKGLLQQPEFVMKCKELGLEYGPAITSVRAGEEGDAYKIQWQGRKELLKYHLKDQNDRESLNCLRVYFFWDSEQQVVVVGWLTSHLDTRNT